MHVRFTEDFDWTPPERWKVQIAYKAGMVMRVTRDCGRAAVAAGKAVKVPVPRRSDAEA